MKMENPKPTVNLPFELLPEGRFWVVGKTYRVKLVVRQTGMNEHGADFEILDASPLSQLDRARQELLTGNKYNE